jgi:excisionase family DNA binding protein
MVVEGLSRSVKQEASAQRDLLEVEEVAGYLGVGPVTIYRWCREGRLPCLKIGRVWRIRRESLESFLKHHERPATLAAQLRSFLTVPDNVIAIAQRLDLLHRLDAAFLKVGEARGGTLIKFHVGEESPEDELRENLESRGLEVSRLEEEGRFRFISEEDPLSGREETLRQLADRGLDQGRTAWVSFNWSKRVDLETALKQQNALTSLVDEEQLVIKTAALEEAIEDWAPETLRRAQAAHSGTIWLSEDGLAMSRLMPLPKE